MGGTKTVLALFGPEGPPAPALRRAVLPTATGTGPAASIRTFLGADAGRVRAACLAVAGPVRENRVPAVNLPWPLDGGDLARAAGLPRVTLLNDLEATAEALPVLAGADLLVLREGRPDPAGARAVIAAGTGLGMAIVSPRGEVVPAEGGHSTFPARTPLETALRDRLAGRYGHVSRERVVSGPGLAAIHAFLRDRAGLPPPPAAPDPAAAAAKAALRGGDPLAEEALRIFLCAYGASAGDLALVALARGGLYVAGGIAAKLASRFSGGEFLDGFSDKGRLRSLMDEIPVRLIRNQDAPVLGAARRAVRDAAASAPGGRPA
ncbi:MAG: glucokinase [Planctomycetes bacterium]|nr:glucokinase [Planctomycetota bacterium]